MVSREHVHGHGHGRETMKCRNGRREDNSSNNDDMEAPLSLSLPSTIRSSKSNSSNIHKPTTHLSIRLHFLALTCIALYAFVVANTNHRHHHDTRHDLRNLNSYNQKIDNHDISPYLLPFLKLENRYNNNNNIINYHDEEEEDEFSFMTTMKTDLDSRYLLNTHADAEEYVDSDSGSDENDNKSKINPENKTCRNYLRQFLSGATDNSDECEGLENAYAGSNCKSSQPNTDSDSDRNSKFLEYNDNEDGDGDGDGDDTTPAIDDFFEEFECCQVISQYYSTRCLYHQRYASLSLLGIVTVLVLCSLMKTFLHSCTFISLQWLPEAGGCIIVGTVVSALFRALNSKSFSGNDGNGGSSGGGGGDDDGGRDSPNGNNANANSIDYSSSFNDELFMYILLPPIIFQASLSIHKKKFTKLLYPILMFAVFGTFLSSVLSGYIVHYFTYYLPDSMTTTIPLLDSMLFGSLISSIDPVATLSILGSMGIATDHVLYVVVFGESILNDGVAIALFDSLKMHLEKHSSHADDGGDGGGEIDGDLVRESLIYFVKICIGSVSVGLFIGVLCTVYFWLLRGKQSPVMEVGTFFCFAFIAYYSSDGLMNCSGIVSIMTAGFIMDIYVRGYQMTEQDEEFELGQSGLHAENENGDGSGSGNSNGNGAVGPTTSVYESQNDETQFVDENYGDLYAPVSSSAMTTRARCCWSNQCSPYTMVTDCKLMFSGVGHMSPRAKVHVGFVADVLANLMETAIFAYLGLFLFSNSKWDDVPLIIIGILSCVLSRFVMVGVTSVIVNGGIILHQLISQFCGRMFNRLDDDTIAMRPNRPNQQDNQDNFYIDQNMQLVLLYSGVRGAVSMSLAENIPLYDAVTKHGSSFKPALKAMTSSSIIFTVFFFGASTYFTLKRQRERLNNQGAENTGRNNWSFIQGILNPQVFQYEEVQHDLSLQEGTTTNLTASLLDSTSNEERHLPPWMDTSGIEGGRQ